MAMLYDIDEPMSVKEWGKEKEQERERERMTMKNE